MKTHLCSRSLLSLTSGACLVTLWCATPREAQAQHVTHLQSALLLPSPNSGTVLAPTSLRAQLREYASDASSPPVRRIWPRAAAIGAVVGGAVGVAIAIKARCDAARDDGYESCRAGDDGSKGTYLAAAFWGGVGGVGGGVLGGVVGALVDGWRRSRATPSTR